MKLSDLHNGDGLHYMWFVACILCSVAVLVHNMSRNVFVFVRQFRPGKLFAFCCVTLARYSYSSVYSYTPVSRLLCTGSGAVICPDSCVDFSTTGQYRYINSLLTYFLTYLLS